MKTGRLSNNVVDDRRGQPGYASVVKQDARNFENVVQRDRVKKLPNGELTPNVSDEQVSDVVKDVNSTPYRKYTEASKMARAKAGISED
jgi:hypothetical protein